MAEGTRRLRADRFLAGRRERLLEPKRRRRGYECGACRHAEARSSPRRRSRFAVSLVGRYYDPATGQFLTVDPLVDETGEPYAYVGGDPVNEIDPAGDAVIADGRNDPWPAYSDYWFETHPDYAGNAVAHFLKHHTVGLCLNASAGLGYYVEASGCIVLAGGHPAVLGSGGFGVTSTGTLGLTAGPLISNADNAQQLGGWFGFAGSSVSTEGPVLGEQTSEGQDQCERTIWVQAFDGGVGFDLPLPAEGHGGASYTWVWQP